MALKKQKFHKTMSLLHKWAGLLLGLQILAWTAGGIVMTWIPLDIVRGEHKIASQPAKPLEDTENLLSLAHISSLSKQPILQATYRSLLGKPVVDIRTEIGGREIRDAVTGELLTPINADLAKQIARADFAPKADIKNVTEVNKHSVDYRGALPVWQVRFADPDDTTLYVSQTQARVVARRSDTWRFYDFFWMLHIMDYDERHDTNNWLLIIFAGLAFCFTVSGLSLLYFRFYRRDFNFLLGKR